MNKRELLSQKRRAASWRHRWLRNAAFAKTFGDYSVKELPDEWLRVIIRIWIHRPLL